MQMRTPGLPAKMSCSRIMGGSDGALCLFSFFNFFCVISFVYYLCYISFESISWPYCYFDLLCASDSKYRVVLFISISELAMPWENRPSQYLKPTSQGPSEADTHTPLLW